MYMYNIYMCYHLKEKRRSRKGALITDLPPPLHYLYFCQIRRPKDILFVRTNRNSSYQITHSTNLSEQILIRVVRTNILFVQTNRNSSKQITDSSEQIATCIVRKKSKFVQTNKIFFIWPFHAAV